MFIPGSSLVCSEVNKTFITHCIAILTGEKRNNDTDNFAISFAFNTSVSKVREAGCVFEIDYVKLLHTLFCICQEYDLYGKQDILTTLGNKVLLS